MKRDEWIVGDFSIRPNGKPDECFYCHEKKGSPHKTGCVIRKRTVVIQMTKVVEAPEDWGESNIEFYYDGRDACESVKYLREATEEDESNAYFHVAGCES